MPSSRMTCALAVLFARSYGQARDIHNAMLARGFTGRLLPLSEPRFRRRDAAFIRRQISDPTANNPNSPIPGT